uniref:Uncharacterized protein n=1 Tax=Lepeophtheirus salmonis TaxID=72036 RepID=A0A0K2T3F8_LEPSM
MIVFVYRRHDSLTQLWRRHSQHVRFLKCI